jgi:hypothetical protein
MAVTLTEGDIFKAHLPHPPYALATFVWSNRKPKIHTYDKSIDGPLREGESLPQNQTRAVELTEQE